ncbi:YadA-like family protein [Acinetobacter guillouiae]|uniref:YadA-like family protein n=1 Tax=Acinetobacter guillouiae TaxID=106649 RepID=UPI0021D1E951|nr:YadA-like family protein [Acinetobacter guillouiae]
MLGNASTDRAATAVDKVSINGEDYSFAGVGSATDGVLSVGKVGGERQIINVAAGEVSASSTDAVNGSQLYATHKAIADSQTHYVSINDSGTQGGNYNNDGAAASGSVAIGVDSSSFGTSGVAIGHNADVSGLQGIAIGNNAQAGYQSIALGFDTVATAFNSMALGNRAIAYTDGTTLGQGTYANKLATAMGNGALAVGQESSAYGYSALAGTDSFNQPSAGTDPDTIGKAYATAMGSRAKASAQGSTAVGAGSVAEVDNGIALGANSVANTGAGAAGYVPISANRPQKDAINATQSTLGAVSVGSVGNTRQITNVAAGTIDSDAVNVAQLKAVQAATTTHYFSINDEGIQGNNYNNDGATGKNALAVGIGAKAVGENDIAIGSGAQAMGGRAVVIGLNAGSGNISDGDANVLIGMNAGQNNDGRWNTAVGSNSGYNTKGQRNTALGDYSGRDVTGSGNIGLGGSAGNSVIGETNLAVGASAGGTVVGSHNTALGRTSGLDVIGNSNTATGLDSGSMVRGSSNSAYGQMSGRSVTGDSNVAIGISSGSNISGNYNAALAYGAGNNSVGNLNTALGFTAGNEVNGDSNSAVGDSAGQRVRGNQNTAQGRVAGQDIFGHQNTAVGAGAGSNVGTNINPSNYNSALGINAGRNVQGNSNIALGDTAGNNVTGSRNVALGRAAGQGLSNVDDATSLGSGAKAAVSNSVALGANSEAIRDVNSEVAYVPLGTTIVAAKAAGGEVSVGTVGKERRISNVAAASLDTDAVNLSQLKAVQAATTTHYFSVNDEGIQGNNYNNDGATGKNALAAGRALAGGESSVAIGEGASAKADFSTAVGFLNTVTGKNSTAIGASNNVAQENTQVLGNNVTTTQANSVVLGNASTDRVATVVDKVTINGDDYAFAGVGAASKGVVSVGKVGGERQIINVAAGEISASSTDAINGSQLYATNQAVEKLYAGAGDTTHYFSVNDEGIQGNNYNNDGATGKNALAAGRALAGGESSVAIGDGTSAKADFSTAVGFLNTVTGQTSVAVGVGNIVAGKNSTAIGASNNVAQENTQVLGNNVTTTQANSVVLGNASTDHAATAVDKVSINGEDYNFAGVGSTANGVVSVGKVGGERQIINVAAGEISASSTDAINGSQLHATNHAVEKLYAGAGDTTHYVSVNDKGIKQGNYNNDGASGVLAVAVGVSASAKGDGATALGLNSSAKSKDAVAIGTDTRAELEGSVALGKGSVANTAAGIAGFDPLTGFGSTNTGSTWRSSAAAFSVGDVSRGITRQITGVAAGTADTDAVNVAQLKAAISKTNEAKGSTETVSAGKNTEVTKTTQADGSTDYQVATKDDVSFDSVTVGNIKADSQSNTISGLADGKVSADSDQAINGSQLHDTAESVANALGGNAKVNPDGTIKTSNIGNTGKDNVHDAIASIHGQVAGAKTSVSAGKNTVVNSSTNTDASNNYQVALAEDIQLNSVTANQVTAKQVTANKVNVGKVTIDGTTNKVSGLANGEITSSSTDAINGSQLHQTNSSVAQHLGGGSTLNKDGSIGAPTYNVAGGTFHNVGDALGAIDTRVSNLEQAFYDTNKNMDDLRNDTYAGIAGAMAVGNLPQPTEAGMSMVSAGVSGYRGETAVAIGVSAITDSNKIVWKMGASADSRSNIGGAVSMGYQWK